MKFNGSISIVEKSGRFGPFNVGTLTTTIGDFVVKNELLDQFEPGTYDVSVIVSQIYLGGYRWGNTQNVTQLCASIEHIECLSESDALPESAEFTDVDPVEAELDTQDVQASFDESAELIDSDDAAAVLGDELAAAYHNREAFNLDLTVGRMKLRAQTSWLKDHGYVFVGTERLWKPKG